MLCPESGARKVGQFALVSYIPDPLGRFLDDLRLGLTPNCNPHAHVTVLPPRPLSEDLKETTHRIASRCRRIDPIELTLGDVEIFCDSKVIFVSLKSGVNQLRSLYRLLNAGPLSYAEAFPYHPHVTIAQNIDAGCVDEMARTARERWAAYKGPRSYPAESLSFVQQVATDMWVDVAEIPLAPVPDPVTV